MESLSLPQWYGNPAEGTRTPLPAETNPDARVPGKNAVHECDAAAAAAANHKKIEAKIRILGAPDFLSCRNSRDSADSYTQGPRAPLPGHTEEKSRGLAWQTRKGGTHKGFFPRA